MKKIRHLIREEIRRLFEKEEFFNGMRVIASHLDGDEPVWDPLYEFLKQIFHDDYQKAADGYMWYGVYEAEPDMVVYFYRHGITRKWLTLDGKGQPYKIEFEMDMQKKEPHLKSINKISFEEAFKELYGNLIKTINKACEYTNCVIPNDEYFMSYSDYKVLRDQLLKKAGVKAYSIKNKDDFGKLKEIDLKEKWSKDYKKSINCSNPKGFSQKAHCAARKKRQKGEKTKSKSPFK